MTAVFAVVLAWIATSGCGQSAPAVADSGAVASATTTSGAPPPPALMEPPPVETTPAPPLRPGTRGPLRIDVDGGAAVVELVLDPPRFMPSEPVLARLRVTVEGDDVEGGLFNGPPDGLGRPPRFVVVFVSAAGRPLPVPVNPDPMAGMNGMSAWDRADARRPTERRLLLPSYAAPLVPGSYVVHAETTVRVRRGSDAEWREVPIAVELPVTVVADDVAAMGAVIDALGARALGTNSDDAEEAAFQLEHVRDPRTLAWWMRIAQVPSYTQRITAIWAIGKHDDAEAVAALIRAMHTNAGDLASRDTVEAREQSARALRIAALHEVADSARPEAFEALMAERDSPDAEFRLTVVHRLSRLPPADARRQLEHYRDDRDRLVRSEARRYLRELPQGP